MRLFSILVIFVVAFGGAAALYEKESRKVKGVLTQITQLQAQVGDLQAEVNRLNGELEAVKLAERRRPNLQTIASRVLRDEAPAQARPAASGADSGRSRQLIASDVTSTPPAIRSRGEDPAEAEWNKPSVDAELHQPSAGEVAPATSVADPYQ